MGKLLYRKHDVVIYSYPDGDISIYADALLTRSQLQEMLEPLIKWLGETEQ